MFRFVLFLFYAQFAYSWYFENDLPNEIVNPINYVLHDVMHLETSQKGKGVQNNQANTRSNEWPNVVVKFKNGTIQSPVDFPMHNIKQMNLPPLILNIDMCDQNNQEVTVENNGHTVEIRLSGKNPFQLNLVGGPLRKDKYLFEQMHFHWGETFERGCENHLNHKCYSIEIHLVFYNSKYGTFDKASGKVDGLCVVAVFGSESNGRDVHELDDFINDLHQLVQPSSKIKRKFIQEFGYFEDIIKKQNWFATPGSLTTPPYFESVTWIVFPKTFLIARQQLDKFRQLKTTKGEYMTSNDRKLQPFNNRPVVSRMG